MQNAGSLGQREDNDEHATTADERRRADARRGSRPAAPHANAGPCRREDGAGRIHHGAAGRRASSTPRTPRTTTPKTTAPKTTAKPAAAAAKTTAKPAAAAPEAAKEPRSTSPATKRPATAATASRAGAGAAKTAKAPTTRARKAPSSPQAGHDGEAPEILDAMLGTRGSATETSASPAEPLKTDDTPTVALPVEAEPTVVLPADAEPTVALPAAAPAGIPASAPEPGAPAQATAEPGTAPPVSDRQDAPTPGAATRGAEHPAPAFPAPPTASAPATGYPRTITEVFADRLDDARLLLGALRLHRSRSYVTRKLAGPVYVVGLVLIGLSTIARAHLQARRSAIATHSFLGAFVFLFGLIITVVGSALAVLLLRVAHRSLRRDRRDRREHPAATEAGATEHTIRAAPSCRPAQ